MKYFLAVILLILFFVPTKVYAVPGDQGDTCRATTPQCNTGLECNEGICTTPCGGPGQQCCQTQNAVRICDVHIIEYENLLCTNPVNPPAGICQVNSCGARGNACCDNGDACQGSDVCLNNICSEPNASITPADQITIPVDPNKKEYFNPNFTSLVIQAGFFVLTLAVIFSVIR